MAHRFSKLTVMTLCLAAALGVSAASGSAWSTRSAEGCPTHLDYVVLASLGDSGNWVGLSTFRALGHIERPISRGVGVQKVRYGAQGTPTDCGLQRAQARTHRG